MKKIQVTIVAIGVATCALAQENQAQSKIPSEVAAEMNKVVATHVKTTAKSKVRADIEEYCKESGITIGKIQPNGALYLSGIERVSANVTSPNFIKARAIAYEKAYHNAVAGYVLDKYGKQVVKEFVKYFSNQSSDRLMPSANVKTATERIHEKTQQLTEAQLDEGLRAMGVVPSGSISERRKLAEDSIVKNSIKLAIGSASGLLPVQTFEGWNEDGKYAVGVVIRGGIETETIADCIKNKMRPNLTRPEAGLTLNQALPTEDELVSQFGVRMFFDEKGIPAFLSFGQWGSSYAGSDEDEAEDAMEHAMQQALNDADAQLTTFINSTMAINDESVKGERRGQNAVFDQNGVPTIEKISGFIDEISKTSTIEASDTMIGRSTVMHKVITHPQSKQQVAVCVRMWSFGQYDAMKRVIERPKTDAQSSRKALGPSGSRRGRSYDF